MLSKNSVLVGEVINYNSDDWAVTYSEKETTVYIYHSQTSRAEDYKKRFWATNWDGEAKPMDYFSVPGHMTELNPKIIPQHVKQEVDKALKILDVIRK